MTPLRCYALVLRQIAFLGKTAFRFLNGTSSVLIRPRVYVPEILPLHARAKGTAIGVSSNWLWVNFLLILARDTTLTLTELRRGYDYTNPPQQPPMASLPHFHVHQPRLYPSGLLLVRHASTLFS